MNERQFFVFISIGLCLSFCQLASSLSDHNKVTFKNVGVQWCDDNNRSNCVNTTILHSNTLAENIPSGHENFAYVTISHQNVPVLYEDSVANIKLDLFELSSSGLAAIDRGAFLNLVVRNLTLKNNVLQELRKGIFKDTRITYSLDFSRNAIRVIENGTFGGLQLTLLDLSGNSLEDVTPGIFYNISVSNLDLSKNNIKIIHREALQSIKHLGSVDLGRNKIKFLEAGTFDNLEGLFGLYLYHNSLESIPTGLFTNHRLKQLHLTGNNISSISPGAFTNTSIVYLYLDHNALEEINSGILKNGGVLYLFLSNNKIREIEPNALDWVIGGVQLEFNDLHSIKKGTFKNPVIVVLLNNPKLKTIEPEALNGTVNKANWYITKAPKFYLERNNILDENSKEYLRNLTESGPFVWHDHIETSPLFPFDE